jgi:atlastin
MSCEHPRGKPISVIKFSDSGEVIVDDDKLNEIFSHPEIQNRKIVILSLIGASRGGKSYFLDYCLRFLYAHVSLVTVKIDSKS